MDAPRHRDVSADPGSVRNELSGTVRGPSVQAGVVHGGVHLHPPPDAQPPMPQQLPPPPPRFTGRAKELRWLDRCLKTDAPALAVLSGPGGVGKTAVAVFFAHRVRHRFPDGQLFVDLAGFAGGDPMDPGEALGMFMRALGLAPQRIPAALAEQVALYRSVTADRSLLVVLDNAYSAGQVRVLLPASATSAVIVTSRARMTGLVPSGARLSEVAPLGTTAAMALLRRIAGSRRIDRERHQAEALAALCAGLPIALCLAAARLAARPQLSVARLATELADESLRLPGLSAPDDSLRVPGLPASAAHSVQATFDASYANLEHDAARLYRLISLSPGPEFGLGPVAAVLALPGASGPEGVCASPAPPPAGAVAALVEQHLLQEVTQERYRFHDLLRLHARQRLEADDDPPLRNAARRAVIEWYLAAAGRADQAVTPYRRRLPYTYLQRPPHLPALADRSDALAWLERERVNLVAASQVALAAGNGELAWHLCDVMWPLFLVRKHYRDRLAVDTRGVRAARLWGNAWAEADMLKRLARSCTVAGDHPAAERHALASMTICDRIGDTPGRIAAAEVLALVHRDAGRREQAADAFAWVLAANRRLGDARAIGLSLLNLGTLLADSDRAGQAVRLLHEAHEVLSATAEVDPYNQARSVLGLAHAHLACGELHEAWQAAERAAERMLRLGSEHERAEALCVLGIVAARRGATTPATHHLRAALSIFEAAGSPRAADVRHRLAALAPPPA